MNRFLILVNFLGVVSLAMLCAGQWRDNSRLDGELDLVQKQRTELRAHIDEQDKTIKSDGADLDDLRGQLKAEQTARKKTELKLTAALADRDKVAAERDNAKTALTQWESAVADRDRVIKQAAANLQTVMNERNDAVSRFNELTVRYNQAVKTLNDAHAAAAKP